jgi:hypothetical protein
MAKPAVPIAKPAAPVAKPTTPAPQNTASTPRQPTKPSVEAIEGLSAEISGMIEAVRMFDEVISAENHLLRAHNPKGVGALQDRKMAALRLYQERLRTLLKDAETIKGMTSEQRGKVKQLVAAMENRAEENALLLRANMDAINRLFEAINTAVHDKLNRDITYSRAGVVNGSLNTNPTAIAFNTTI